MVSTTSGRANRAMMNLGALETIVVIGTFWLALSASLASAQAGPALTPKPLIDRSDVHCVHHDDVGFVWLCTDDGIVRFDGENAVTFGAGTRGLLSCGEVLLVRLEGLTSVRFGRTAGPPRPRVLALVRASTGRYFVIAGDGLFEFIVKQMLDGANCFRPVTGRADLLHSASVRHLPLTPMP